MRSLILPLMAALLMAGVTSANETRQTKNDHYDAFRQLDAELPTPNVYRTASGAPGSRYWQQRADHNIKVKLNEDNKSINASETIRYTNNSPDSLRYIWIQLDQNRFRADSAARLTETASQEEGKDILTYGELARQQRFADVDHGFVVERVADGRGRDMNYTIVDTMMRIDLAQPLSPASARHSRSTGRSTSSRKRSSVVAVVTITFRKTTLIYTSWRNGSRAWLPTPIMSAGSISSFSVGGSSRSNLETMKSKLLCPPITSSRQPASCKTQKPF